MANIKEKFTASCGELVTFMRSDIKGRTLRIEYVIDGEIKTPRTIELTLMNGADREIGDKAAIAGILAAQKAYVVSGKRDADLAASLQGKLT